MKFPILSQRDQRTLAVILLVCLPFLGWSVIGTPPFADTVDRSYHFQVDPNTATAIELRLLPGIGEKLAEAIILDRHQNGPFKTSADLQRVKGIGPKKVESMKPFVEAGKTEQQTGAK